MPPQAPAAGAAKSTGGTSAAPAPGEGNKPAEGAPAAGAKPGAKVEATPNEELVGLFVQYDETVEKAESYFIQLVELIQKRQLDRATVVVSMMRARKITFETAQSQYSRMKKIFNNEEVLKELKDGKISLKVARERTTDKQANPKSADPKNKEQKYNAALKTFVAAAKEGGFPLKEIMLGVEAELKSAGIK
jgi:hypothetical protein